MKITSMKLIQHLQGGLGLPRLTKDATAAIAAASPLDQGTLEGIFDEFAPAVYKYLLRSGLGAQEADQTVGDIFALVLDKLSERKVLQTNLRTYIFQIAYQFVVDHARNRQRAAPLDVGETAKEESKPIQTLTEENMFLGVLSTTIEQVLTAEQRNVIVLRFQEEFSLKETAEIVGKDVNDVKALQDCGFNKLREVLSRRNKVNKYA